MLIDIYLTFLKIGLFTIGGGYSAIPLYETEIAAGRGWLSFDELTDIVVIAELSPGPFALNAATFIGASLAGIPGGIAATLGFITFPVIITAVLSFVLLNKKDNYITGSVLNTLRSASAGIIASAAASLLVIALFNDSGIIPVNAVLLVIAFIALIRFKASPILVIITAGVIGVFI